jgi:hypothetical protein
VITADTCTSVLPTTQRRCATAKLVLAAARRTRDKIRKKGRRNRPDTHPATGTPVPTGPVPGKTATTATAVLTGIAIADASRARKHPPCRAARRSRMLAGRTTSCCAGLTHCAEHANGLGVSGDR